MTLKELEEYSVIANQIQSFRHEYIPSFIKGVDTTKSNVQSFNIADSTADTESKADKTADSSDTDKKAGLKCSKSISLLKTSINGFVKS